MQKVMMYDNFLSQDIFENIREVILGERLPWYHSDSTIYDDGCPQYSHMFYSDCEPCSSFWEHIKPVVSQLSPLGLTRVKFNATPRTPEIVESPLHYDVIDQDDKPVDVKICILYMNDNDGYTYFEDGSKVESKANRVIMFSGKYKHGGTTCTNVNRRIVGNFVYL